MKTTAPYLSPKDTPAVCALGYMAWLLNILAGSSNQLATLDDPRYAWLREEMPDGKQLPLY